MTTKTVLSSSVQASGALGSAQPAGAPDGLPALTVTAAAVSVPRRTILRGGVGATLSTVFGSGMLAACGGGETDTSAAPASAQTPPAGTRALSASAAVASPGPIATAAAFAGASAAWTTIAPERYSSNTGNTAWNGIALLTGFTAANKEAWVELQYPSTDAGGLITLDTAAGLLSWTSHRYVVQLRPNGVLRYGVNNAASLTDVGYTFPSAHVNHRVRLHRSAAGTTTIQTTVDNGTTWTVRLSLPGNTATQPKLYWRLHAIQDWDLYEPRQYGVQPVATTFDALYAPGFSLRSDTNFTSPVPTPALPTVKSANLTSPAYTDPEHGTKVFQVTQLSTDEPQPDAVALSIDYARRQAFNCTGTRRLAVSSKGAWYCYDVATNAVINIPGAASSRQVPFLAGYDCDPVWHPTDPDVIWATGNFGAGGAWKAVNVVTGTVTTLFSLVGRVPAIPTAGRFRMCEEGQPSLDGRYWAFLVEDDAGVFKGIVTYDRQTDKVLSARATTNRPDSVAASCSGRYAVINWSNARENLTTATAHQLSFDEANGGRAYPIDNLFSPTWTELCISAGHGDCAIAADGRDVWVSVSYSPGENVNPPGYDGDGWVYYRYMDTGESYTYPTMSPYASKGGGGSAALHFSGRASLRPGWCVATYFDDKPVGDWNDRSVLLLELGGRNQVLRVARHQMGSGNSGYGTPNHDLTQILFRTDRRGTSKIEQFMVGLPSWAVPVAGLIEPSKKTDPLISGASTPGGTIQRAAGSYAGLPRPTVSGQWQRSTDAGATWSDVPGAVNASYVVPTSTTNGTRYRWRESGVNALGVASAVSNVLTIAPLSAPLNTVPPSAPSTGYTNTPLTASAGTWTGNPAPAVSWVWQRSVSGTWSDTTNTSLTTTLTVQGSWRLKVTASNGQGNPLVVYSNVVVVGPPPVEPSVASTVTFNQASGTTLESISSAWEGITSVYQVQNGTLRNGATEGWDSSIVWLTTAGGNNQAAQATLKAPADLQISNHLSIHLHTNGTQAGYRVEISATQLRLYRHGAGPEAGPVNHGVNLMTTDLTLKVTNLQGRVRVYVNGATTPVIDYTDPSPLTGGYSGLSSYSGADSSRVKISQFKYGAT